LALRKPCAALARSTASLDALSATSASVGTAVIESLRAAAAVEVYVAQDPADPLVAIVPGRSTSITGLPSGPLAASVERTAKTIARFLAHRGVQMRGDNVAAGAEPPPSDAAVSGATSAPALATMRQLLAGRKFGQMLAGD